MLYSMKDKEQSVIIKLKVEDDSVSIFLGENMTVLNILVYNYIIYIIINDKNIHNKFRG